MEDQMAKRGDFFSVDKGAWHEVCALGMNAAVAYLVLACFSDGTNRRTKASAAAVERHTGVSRHRAKAAITALLGSRLLRLLNGGTIPVYQLPPLRELDSKETPVEPDYDRDRIWIPNSLVVGAGGATPPVERVRQSQDVMTLRLLVDLYSAQFLYDDGGVARRHLQYAFKREKVTDRAEFVLYAFIKDSEWVHWTDLTRCHRRNELTKAEERRGANHAVDFFPRLYRLRDLGLVEWAYYLAESDSPDSELIHPIGFGDSSDLEDRVGCAVRDASRAILGEELDLDRASLSEIVVPVPRHFSNVALVGVARLRHRPRTAATAHWWSDYVDKCQRWEQAYRHIAARFCGPDPDLGLQHQGIIKAVSR